MDQKTFRIQLYAYQYYSDFTIKCVESASNIETAIVDRLGEGDIKWEYLGEMMNPRTRRITYEEVIDGTQPVQTKKVLGVEVAAGV